MSDFYYRKVDAYNLAKELAKYVYQLLRSFPPEERFALTDQTRRAAISVPANIRVSMTIYGLKKSLEEKSKNQDIINNPR